jgi:hypothetical protein
MSATHTSRMVTLYTKVIVIPNEEGRELLDPFPSRVFNYSWLFLACCSLGVK